MKALVPAILALPLFFSGAHADTVFVGNVFISHVSGSGSCTSTFQLNDTARALYRPRGGALGNGGDSHLAYITSRSSFVMQVPNNDFRPSINYAGSGVGSKANLLSRAGGITVWQQTPSSVGQATPTVSIRGRFANFFAISNCIVEIRGNLILR